MPVKMLSKDAIPKTVKGRYKILIDEAIKQLNKQPNMVALIESNDGKKLLPQGMRYSLPQGYRLFGRLGNLYLEKVSQ